MGSLDRYSYSNASSLHNAELKPDTSRQHQKQVNSNSTSHDHENFEVVLDPTSLIKEGKSPKIVKQQRVKRWRFSASTLSQKEKEKEKESINKQINRSSLNTATSKFVSTSESDVIELSKSTVDIPKQSRPINEEESCYPSLEEMKMPNESTDNVRG